MSTNTIKLTSGSGEIFLTPQETGSYKGVALFGYGYLDWGRVVNQGIVTLIDRIEAIDTNDQAQNTFDLTVYKEEEAIIRTQEFNTWKAEYKQMLLDTVDTFVESTNTTISDFIAGQELLNSSTAEEISALGEKFSDDFALFTSTVNDSVQEIINVNLGSIITKVNDSVAQMDQSTVNLNSSKQFLEQKVVEFNSIFENFKTNFQEAYDTFKEDTTNAIAQNKDNIIQYVNEKLLGYNSSISSQEERLQALEISMDGVDLESIREIIVQNVNALAEQIINATVDGLVSRVEALEEKDSNQTATITEIVNNTVNPLFTDIDERFETVNNLLTTYNSKISDITLDNGQLKTWQRDFDTTAANHFGSKDIFFEEIGFIRLESMISAATDTTITRVIKRGIEANIKQTSYNLKKVLETNTKQEQALIHGLRNSDFDETALIRTDTSVDGLLNSGVQEFELSKIQNGSFNLVDFGTLTKEGTNKINRVYLSLSIPASSFSANQIDVKNIKVSLNGAKVDDDHSYYQAPVVKLPMKTLALEDINDYYPGYDDYLYANTFGHISDTQFYSDTGLTDLIIIEVQDSVAYDIDDPITITFGSDSITFTASDFNVSSTPSYLFDLLENSANLTPSVQALLNNQIRPIIDYNKISKDTSIPVSKIVNTTDGNKLYLKVNLPESSTITKIEYNNGSSMVTKTITNRAKFDNNMVTFNSNGWNNTDNYYEDIQTTGILKFDLVGNTAATTGTVTYKVNGTTHTKDFSSSSAGLNLNSFNIEFNGSTDQLDITESGTTQYEFSKTGDFTAKGNVYAYSDENLKENIKKLPDDILFKLLKINTYQFNYISSEEDKIEFGVIAQEIAEVFPELVSTESEYLKVNYIGLIPVVIEATKILETRMTYFESKMEAFERRLYSLEESGIK